MTSVTMTSRQAVQEATETARAAIVDHHAALAKDLHERVAAVHAAVARETGHEETLQGFLAFLTDEVLPHAEAEERVLYRAAQQGPARLLVAGMILEHETLVARVQALADTTVAGLTAAAAVEAIGLLFDVHVAKENDLLLPALAEDPHIDLPALLSGMHSVLTRAGDGSNGSDGSGPGELDVRALPHRGRHDVIFARLEDLASGDRLTIVNDHDPVPLHHQIDAVWPGQFEWSYLQAGPALWRVAIIRQP